MPTLETYWSSADLAQHPTLKLLPLIKELVADSSSVCRICWRSFPQWESSHSVKKQTLHNHVCMKRSWMPFGGKPDGSSSTNMNLAPSDFLFYSDAAPHLEIPKNQLTFGQSSSQQLSQIVCWVGIFRGAEKKCVCVFMCVCLWVCVYVISLAYTARSSSQTMALYMLEGL